MRRELYNVDFNNYYNYNYNLSPSKCYQDQEIQEYEAGWEIRAYGRNEKYIQHFQLENVNGRKVVKTQERVER